MATATTTATADATATEGPRQTPDAHVYYGYLFHKTGAAQTQPTPVLDALLRAIGIFIVRSFVPPSARGRARSPSPSPQGPRLTGLGASPDQ